MMKITYFKRIILALAAMLLVVGLTSCSDDTLDAPLFGTAADETDVVGTPEENVEKIVKKCW